MSTSLEDGKAEAISFLRQVCPPVPGKGDEIPWVLDIGAGRGYWVPWLEKGGYVFRDAVEAFEGYVKQYGLETMYRTIYVDTIQNFLKPFSRRKKLIKGGKRPAWDWEIAIMGDVLEHLTVEDASRVLAVLTRLTKVVLVSVPWQWPQAETEENPLEKHEQADLTPELMEERYGKWLECVGVTRRIGLFATKGTVAKTSFARDPFAGRVTAPYPEGG